METLSQAFVEMVLMALATEVPVPFVPSGAKKSDPKKHRFYRWNGYYFHSERVTGGWTVSAYGDEAFSKHVIDQMSDMKGKWVQSTNVDENRALHDAYSWAMGSSQYM